MNSLLKACHLRVLSDVMRQVLTILLLGLFGFSLVSPLAFASDADSKLPACCRRNGAHRCVMAATFPPSGPAVEATPCRSCPGAQVLTAPTGAVLLKVSEGSFESAFSESALQSLAEARRLTRASRSNQKRGPPTLLS
jgi:hypothetical protein